MRSATSWESENGPIDDMVAHGFKRNTFSPLNTGPKLDVSCACYTLRFEESTHSHIVLVKEQIGREMLARRWPEGIWVSAARSCYGYTVVTPRVDGPVADVVTYSLASYKSFRSRT